MYVKLSRVALTIRMRWHRQLIADFARMVGHLKGGIEDGIELPDRSNEVRLTARDEPGRNAGDLSQSMQPQMFAVEHALRLHELFVELVDGQRRRQNGVLDVEQAIVAANEFALLAVPDLGAGIGRGNAHVDDFRY